MRQERKKTTSSGCLSRQPPLWLTGIQFLWGSKCGKYSLEVILPKGQGSWGFYAPKFSLLLGTLVLEYFACLQSSIAGSGNVRGLLGKGRLGLQLEAGQV